MTTPTKECLKRMKKEWKELSENPPDNILARPNTSNVLEWHFVILGPDGTPYEGSDAQSRYFCSVLEGGVYHGKLCFKPDYPFSPPGRFKPNERLCLSMSDYHPESWNPVWSISTILVGLLSFMLDSDITAGSVESSRAEKVSLAQKSMEFNRNDPVFQELFPQLL